MQQATATAQLEKSAGKEVGHHPYDDISMSFVVNARGRACLMHAKRFNANPVWVKYLTSQRKLQLIFDDGTNYTVNYVMNEKANKILLNLDKVLIFYVEDGKPIDGYDTKIIRE